MTTQVKQTVRAEIQNYGANGRTLFDQIEQELRNLADVCALVDYLGPNSDRFKEDCTRFAETFALDCSTTMKAMTDAINADTSFIAQNLGGAGIQLEPPTTVIVAPPFERYTDTERIDGDRIREMRDTAQTHFKNVRTHFTTNETNFIGLGNNGWIGVEYDRARDAMVRLTADVLGICDESETAMTTRVNEQLQSLHLPI